MRIELFPSFASSDDCAALAAWSLENLGGPLQQGAMQVGRWRNRFTTRMCAEPISFPPQAYRLRDRIWGMFDQPGPPPMPNGNGGIVVICHQPGSDTAEHLDISPVEGRDVLRCNIVVQDSGAGGALTVGERKVAMGEGDLHCYVATRHRHAVSLVEGRRPRVIWLFSFCIDGEAWDAGRISFGTRSAAA